MDKKIFIIADAACDTGFANVTHNLVKRWNYETHILAINYHGDSHWLQQHAHLYNPQAEHPEDVYGYSRVKGLLQRIQPDFIFMINDPWVCAEFTNVLPTDIPAFIYTPVDSLHIKDMYLEPLNRYTHIIAYTEFARQELSRKVTQPISVLYHGVDKALFYPDRSIRESSGFPDDWFIVNITDRNTPRKRLDLAFYAFAKWVEDKPDTIKLHYHGALKDQGWDLIDLANYLGMSKRLMLTNQNMVPGHGITLEGMRNVYNIADVGLSTSMAEGFSLPTLERMACNVPMIVPNHSAFSEWPLVAGTQAVYHTDVEEAPAFATNGLNTAQRIPSVKSTIQALETLYTNKELRTSIANNGYALSQLPLFDWDYIARQFETIFEDKA